MQQRYIKLGHARHLLHYSCIVASSYCGLHQPYDTYNADKVYRLDSPTRVVFRFFSSRTLSAILLQYIALPRGASFFGIS